MNLPIDGVDPPGHKDVATAQIYTHVLNQGGHAVLSPLDR